MGVSCLPPCHAFVCSISRSASAFIVKAFESQLRQKLQLANLVEKNDGEHKLFKSQVLLGGLDIPFVMARSPNIIILVNCNGAAVYSDGVSQVMGVTPSSEQIKDIIAWLLGFNSDLTVWTTNSLVAVGYPNASMLGDVCGMAIIRFASSDFLLWFRSKVEIEIKWGNSPQHIANKEDGKQMHPSSSSKGLLHSCHWCVPIGAHTAMTEFDRNHHPLLDTSHFQLFSLHFCYSKALRFYLQSQD